MSTTVDEWNAFIRGSSEEAVVRFADSYAATGDQGVLYNLGLALLDVGNLEMAAEVYDTVIKHDVERQTTSDAVYAKRGIVDWMAGRHAGAVRLWEMGLSAVYADAAGGVLAPSLLWFAGVRLGDLPLRRRAEELLRRFRLRDRAAQMRQWPGPRAVASYLCGEVADQTFLQAWTDGPDGGVLETRRRCIACFWVGVRTETVHARHDLFARAVASKEAILESEYFLAKSELRSMKAAPSRE